MWALYRCDQAPHPVRIKVLTGSKCGTALSAEQAPYCPRFLGRLLRAHGNVECSPRCVQMLGTPQAPKELEVLRGPKAKEHG